MEPSWDEEGMREWARHNASKGRWVSGSKESLEKLRRASAERSRLELGRTELASSEEKTQLEKPEPDAAQEPGLGITLQHVVIAAAAVGTGVIIGQWWKRKQRDKQIAARRAEIRAVLPTMSSIKLVPSAVELPSWAY